MNPEERYRSYVEASIDIQELIFLLENTARTAPADTLNSQLTELNGLISEVGRKMANLAIPRSKP